MKFPSLVHALYSVRLWGLSLGGGTLISLLGSCASSTEAPLPRAEVNFSLSLQESSYRELLSPGGVLMIDRPVLSSDRLGLRGLVLIHLIDSDTEYQAFDLACPYDPAPWIALQRDGFQLHCPRCESRYDLLSGLGQPVSGPSRVALRRYRVQRQGLYGLRVTN